MAISFDISPYAEDDGKTYIRVGGGNTTKQCRELIEEQNKIQEEIHKYISADLPPIH